MTWSGAFCENKLTNYFYLQRQRSRPGGVLPIPGILQVCHRRGLVWENFALQKGPLLTFCLTKGSLLPTFSQIWLTKGLIFWRWRALLKGGVWNLKMAHPYTKSQGRIPPPEPIGLNEHYRQVRPLLFHTFVNLKKQENYTIRQNIKYYMFPVSIFRVGRSEKILF